MPNANARFVAHDLLKSAFRYCGSGRACGLAGLLCGPEPEGLAIGANLSPECDSLTAPGAVTVTKITAFRFEIGAAKHSGGYRSGPRPRQVGSQPGA
jgi:hypothetical protein